MTSSVRVRILILLLLALLPMWQAAPAEDLLTKEAGQLPKVKNQDEEELPDFSFVLPHLTLGVGAGQARAGRTLNNYVGGGLQFSAWLRKTVWESSDTLKMFATLGYRYEIFAKSLTSPQDGSAASASRLSAYNFDLLIGVSQAITPELQLTAEIGPALQRRTFSISSDSSSYLGDDYYAGTGVGILTRIGGRYALPKENSIGGFYAWEQGARLRSPKLKYDGNRVNINERQNTWGIDVAHDF